MAWIQAQKRKEKLQKTFRKTKNGYGSGVWYDDERGFYYRYTATNTSGLAKYLRRVGNKRVRHSKEAFQHGDYRKVFDYKWTLF